MSARQILHTFVATFVATAVITGCSPADKATPTPAQAPAPAETPANGAPGDGGIQPGLSWVRAPTANGAGLVLNDAAGKPVIQLACMGDPDRLIVRVSGFNPIASEERLSVGVDDEAYALVAASTRPGPGVEAEGAIPADLLTRLPTANAVSASYGAQTVGPHMPPEQAMSQAFADDCRKLLAP